MTIKLLPIIFISFFPLYAKETKTKITLSDKPLSFNLFQFEANTALEKKIIREAKKIETDVNSGKITTEKAISLLCHLGLEALDEPSIPLKDKRSLLSRLLLQTVVMNKKEGSELYKSTMAHLKRLQKENPTDKKLVELEDYYKQLKPN